MTAHEPQEWKLTLVHRLTFLEACNNVMIAIEEPDLDRLAFQMVKRNIITIGEIDQMMDKLTSCGPDELLEMYEDDVLLLYTIVELNTRLMISDKGDEMIEGLQKPNEKYTVLVHPFDAVKIHQLTIAALSVFIRSVSEEYANNPVFKARRRLIEELNAYI